MMEKKFSLLELDEKNVNRKLLVLNEENIKLKEETSKLITQVTQNVFLKFILLQNRRQPLKRLE